MIVCVLRQPHGNGNCFRQKVCNLCMLNEASGHTDDRLLYFYAMLLTRVTTTKLNSILKKQRDHILVCQAILFTC